MNEENEDQENRLDTNRMDVDDVFCFNLLQELKRSV